MQPVRGTGVVLAYCCVEGGATGTGIISSDPQFADPARLDFHLRSAYGRRDPALGAWVSDSTTSPCIDAGDPASTCVHEPQPNFGRANMGAYGNTESASRSGWNIPCDVNGDCKVNIIDMLQVRNRLGQEAATGENWKYDVNRDSRINVLDLMLVRSGLGTRCTLGSGG